MVSKAVKSFVGSCCWVGFIPGAPGTYGSILAVAVFFLAGGPLHLGGWLALLGMVIVAMWALSDAEGTFGGEDPGPVVLDEFAGMWVTFLVGGSADWLMVGVGFVFFRVLDIVKPFPIRRIERMGGWQGIMADDLAAGLAAGLIVRLACLLVAGA